MGEGLYVARRDALIHIRMLFIYTVLGSHDAGYSRYSKDVK